MTTNELTLESKPKTFGIVGVVAGFLGLLTVLVGPTVRDALQHDAWREYRRARSQVGAAR